MLSPLGRLEKSVKNTRNCLFMGKDMLGIKDATPADKLHFHKVRTGNEQPL